MSYGAYLRELLRPLRIYGLEGTANGGELEAQGKALDGVEAAMEEVQREMLICTAEGRGLEAVEALLARKPVAASLERRRAALAALLRIGGDSFTLTAINDNLKGCGLNAVASETETPGVVEVRFPDVPGIPDGFFINEGHPGGYSALPSGHTVCLLVHHLGPHGGALCHLGRH